MWYPCFRCTDALECGSWKCCAYNKTVTSGEARFLYPYELKYVKYMFKYGEMRLDESAPLG